jgi:TonB-linked SusC/RagA family outer membrane protein
MKFYLTLLLVMIMGEVMAQSGINVSGVVRDESGEPIIGASVLVKGTLNGMVTDIDGQFTLKNVDRNGVLVVSFVGYKAAEVKAAPKVNVVLKQDVEVLDEIIVTAFGTSKKAAFTGSATVVGSEKLEQKQVSNVMQSLAGEVAGLQIDPSTSPGATSSIVIRGKGSIYADSDPLIVVDGIPFDGGWNNINPADVESVTVTKGAAANALYGARGANGVVQITTKKGKAGKATVTLDAKWGANSRASRDYDRITDPGQYYEMYYKALYNSYVSAGSTPTSAHQQANENLCGSSSVGGLGYNVYSVPNGQYLIGTNGKLNPNATLGNRIYRNGQVYTLYPDNWTDAAYKTGLRQEYNVSISAGNDQGQLYSSFGYLSDEGIVAASDYERFSGRLRGSYKVKSWLTFGANVGYTHSNTDQAYGSNTKSSYSSTNSASVNTEADGTYVAGNIFGEVANMGPIYPLYVRDGDGNIISDSNGLVHDYGDGIYNVLDSDGNTIVRPVSSSANCVNSRLMDFYKISSNSINADAYADITFLRDFKFTFKAGTTVLDNRSSAGSNPYYGYSAKTGGYLYKQSDRTTTLNLQQLLHWTRSFGDNNLSVLLGHENYTYKYENLYASKADAVDYWGYQELSGYLSSPYIPGSYTTKYNTEGYIAQVMYDYDNRYFAQASYRRDASSRFHPDHRWGNFWSAGLAWIVSKESWFKADWVNNLKLKASYGEQGNDRISDYAYTDRYTISNVNDALALPLYYRGNEEISWETSREFNLGVEFDLFKNRLGGSIEFYNRLTTDMLLWYDVPYTLGYTGYYKNVGDLRNRGVEISLNGSPIRTRNIDWGLNLNVTFNKQKVTYIPGSNKSLTVDGYEGFQQGNNYFVGEGLPLSTFYIPLYAGVSEDGQSQWYYTDANGEQKTTTTYSKADYHLVKSEVPLYGGFGTSLKVYDFDLSAQFTYSIGGKGYDQEYALLMTNPISGSTGYALHTDMLNAWSEDNTGSSIPRWQYGDTNTGTISDRFLINNSYLNFQNIQVGYTLPKRTVASLGLSKLRFYFSADNVYLWSKRKGYDPRFSSAGYGIYSPMRTISGGINIQF